MKGCALLLLLLFAMYFSCCPVERARDTDELLHVFVSALDRSHFETLKIMEYNIVCSANTALWVILVMTNYIQQQ